MSAPERIWADPPSLFDGVDLWHEKQDGAELTAVEYIRKDASDAAIAAARAEGWNAAIKAAADEAEEHKHFAKGIECCAECIRKMARPKAQP